MLDKIADVSKEVENYQAQNAQEIEDFRLKFISKKSVINDLFERKQ